MKNLFKKLLAVFLCLVVAFGTFAGCKKIEEQPKQSGAEPESFAATETYLVKDSKTEYKIVIPEVSSNEERYAAEELVNFMRLSTDCTFEVITDKGLTADNNQKYLSIGRTSLFAAQTDIVATSAELGELGPSVHTRGNTVYMVGSSDYGTLFSVYKFMYYQIGFKAYAYDCVKYDYYSDLKLLDIDYSYNPGIDYCSGSDSEMVGPGKVEEALRMYGFAAGNGGNTLDGKLYNSLWCHTISDIVSQTRYPEYYPFSQLCYSNPGAIEAAAESLSKTVSTASGPFLMIGGLDNVSSCACENCAAEGQKYGGAGGVYMRFLNAVAEKVEAYCKENNIDKEVTFVGLMYYAYAEPPVVENADGTFSPAHESVVARNGQISVAVCYTPIDACFMHPFGEKTCKTNETYVKHIKGWAVCAEKLFTYLYGTNFGAAKYHFNNWSFVGDTYKYLAENNFVYLTEEACGWNGISPMSSMRQFMRRALSWDPTQSTEALINEFIDAYYGPGSEYVKKYFFSVLENFERVATMKETECAGIYYAISTSEYWTRDLLLKYEGYLKTAMYEIERSGLIDKDVYYERVYREYFLIKYDMYELHKRYFTQEELAAVEAELEVAKAKYNVYG